MNKISLFLSAMVLAALSAPVVAEEIPTMDIEQYRIGAAPAGSGLNRPARSATETQSSAARERSSAINGTLYSVIAPTYNGATQSFIRLFNGAQQASVFSVTVVGSPSGNTYGTANISVPRSASQQLSLGQILSLAGAGALTGGDTSYALYVQNPDTSVGLAARHLQWRQLVLREQ